MIVIASTYRRSVDINLLTLTAKKSRCVPYTYIFAECIYSWNILNLSITSSFHSVKYSNSLQQHFCEPLLFSMKIWLIDYMVFYAVSHITAAWKYVRLHMHKFRFWSGSFLLPFTPIGGSTRLHWEVSLNTIQVSFTDINKKCFRNIYAPHGTKFRFIFSVGAKPVRSK